MRALALSVHVGLAYGRDVHAERFGHVFDVGLADKHALRPAKAAERRVRRRIGHGEVSADANIVNLIRVLAVK